MLEILPLYLLASLMLAISPGPDMLMIIRQSVTMGRRAGLVAVLGIAVGLFIHTCLVSLGLAALLVESKKAFAVIQYAGAAYLFYLGVTTCLSREHILMRGIDKAKKHRYSFSKSFLQGLGVNLLNPKVILFFLAFLPQFVNTDLSLGVGEQLFILGCVFNVVGSGCDALIAYFFGYAKTWLEEHPVIFFWQQKLMGILFIGIAAHLVFVFHR